MLTAKEERKMRAELRKLLERVLSGEVAFACYGAARVAFRESLRRRKEEA